MELTQLKQILEALIFASDAPLTIKQMEQALQDVNDGLVPEALNALIEEYTHSQRAFMIVKVAGGYQFSSRPEFARWIKRLYEGKVQSRLSRAALETLAIITFKQPVSRTEIGAIRGVNSDGVVRSLLEKKMIAISGRAPDQGRPLLYKTTDFFLQYFGINDLAELPRPREIEELLAEGEASLILADLEKKQEQENLKHAHPQTEGSNTTPAQLNQQNLARVDDAVE